MQGGGFLPVGCGCGRREETEHLVHSRQVGAGSVVSESPSLPVLALSIAPVSASGAVCRGLGGSPYPLGTESDG